MKRQKTTRGTSPLLIDEEPLQVIPSLAVAVGLNEAIILQQIHYWMKHTTHIIDEVAWVYNSYEQWKAQFPFWSAQTIRRAILQLEELGVVISANFNRNPIDKTKWYTINYKRLKDFCRDSTDQDDTSINQDDTSSSQGDISTDQDDTSINQDDTSNLPRRYVHAVKMIEPIPETTAETTDRDLNTHPLPPQNGCVRDTEAIDHQEATLTPPLPFTQGFEALCAVYPVECQEGLHEAFATWYARDLEPRAKEIIGKVRRLLETRWLNKERRYIPLLRTWLDKGRYNDPEVSLKQPQPARRKRPVI